MKLQLKLILLFLSSMSISFANETGYEVELIVFEDSNARYLQSEDWTYNDMLRNKLASKTIEEVEPEVDQKPDPEYKQLPWEGAKLTNQLERLLKNNNFRVLAAKRWKQTGLDRKHAFNISIDDSPEPPPVENDIEADKITDASPKDLVEQDVEETLPLPKTEPYLTGNIKLIMSRYLHFNVDLQYIKPFEDAAGIVTNRVFPIINERRMRSREIHYIDHPLIGIMVLATPYEIPDQENQSESHKPPSTEYKTM